MKNIKKKEKLDKKRRILVKKYGKNFLHTQKNLHKYSHGSENSVMKNPQ